MVSQTLLRTDLLVSCESPVKKWVFMACRVSSCAISQSVASSASGSWLGIPLNATRRVKTAAKERSYVLQGGRAIDFVIVGFFVFFFCLRCWLTRSGCTKRHEKHDHKQREKENGFQDRLARAKMHTIALVLLVLFIWWQKNNKKKKQKKTNLRLARRCGGRGRRIQRGGRQGS